MEELLALIDDTAWHGFVIFLRVSAMSALLPGFGERAVPARVKIVVAIAFTAIVAPALPLVEFEQTQGNLVLLTLTETIVGFAMGMGIRLFVLALQTAGSIAAQCTSLSQVLGGAGADPMPAMSYVLMLGGMTIALISGLHFKAAELLILSYGLFPIGIFVEGGDLSEWGVGQVARAFTLAFTLAAPFVILSVLYNFALGAINKAMPQLMVAFVGAPLITLGGLFVLFLSAPVMLAVWLETLDGFLANPFGPLP